jgi:glucosyl-dolichyl phosphate glucuronosyltransferase
MLDLGNCAVFVSVTIQTYNRSAVLAETLESLRSLHCPAGVDYEILVVDNNSTDDTPRVIEKYAAVLAPRLRSVFEPRQGLSHARNRALQEAKGEIVSFLDDDVIVDSNWLTAVAGAFAEHSAAVVGGKSYLIFRSQRPSWLSEHYEFLLSRLDYGDQALVGTDKDLYGLNFSVRKDVVLKAGGFDAALGRCGPASVRSGEESDLLRRVRDLGGLVVYEPRAVVGHIIPGERLRMKWFIKRAFAPGLEEGAGLGASVVHLLRCCGSVLRSLVRGELRSDVLFGKLLSAVSALRTLYESLRRWRQPHSER